MIKIIISILKKLNYLFNFAILENEFDGKWLF